MVRYEFNQLNDTIFIIRDRRDDSEILIWLKEIIKQDYHTDYVGGYYAGFVLQITFDLVRDAILFKMIWG